MKCKKVKFFFFCTHSFFFLFRRKKKKERVPQEKRKTLPLRGAFA
jgi:hypothetical protein